MREFFLQFLPPPPLSRLDPHLLVFVLETLLNVQIVQFQFHHGRLVTEKKLVTLITEPLRNWCFLFMMFNRSCSLI